MLQQVLNPDFTLDSPEIKKKRISRLVFQIKPMESEFLRVVPGHQYSDIVYQVIPMCRRSRNTVLEANIRMLLLIQPGSVREIYSEKLVLKLTFKEWLRLVKERYG